MQRSAVKLTPRYERFADYVARGMTMTEAGRAVGWSEHTVQQAAHRAAKREDVQQRILEIREELGRQRDLVLMKVDVPTRERVLRDLLEVGDKAKQQGNLTAQLRALELVGKELGMFVQRSSVTVESPLARLSPEQLLALAAALDQPERLVISTEVEEEEEPAEVVDSTGEEVDSDV